MYKNRSVDKVEVYIAFYFYKKVLQMYILTPLRLAQKVLMRP